MGFSRYSIYSFTTRHNTEVAQWLLNQLSQMEDLKNFTKVSPLITACCVYLIHLHPAEAVYRYYESRRRMIAVKSKSSLNKRKTKRHAAQKQESFMSVILRMYSYLCVSDYESRVHFLLLALISSLSECVCLWGCVHM